MVGRVKPVLPLLERLVVILAHNGREVDRIEVASPAHAAKTAILMIAKRDGLPAGSTLTVRRPHP